LKPASLFQGAPREGGSRGETKAGGGAARPLLTPLAAGWAGVIDQKTLLERSEMSSSDDEMHRYKTSRPRRLFLNRFSPTPTAAIAAAERGHERLPTHRWR
jgi:hypothetical protein